MSRAAILRRNAIAFTELVLGETLEHCQIRAERIAFRTGREHRARGYVDGVHCFPGEYREHFGDVFRIAAAAGDFLGS